MTDVALSPDLSDYEAELTSPLALPAAAQDLLFHQARSANWFTEAPVTEEQMRAVYDLIKWGPTAMNSQPLRIVLVRTPEARARLVAAMAEGNRARTEAAPLVAILAADVDFHEEFDRTFPVNPGAKNAFAANPTGREEAGRFNAALQIGYFLVGVRAAGLAAGPMGGFDAEAVNRTFFADGRHRALLVVNLGQPADNAFRPRLPRLDFEDVVTSV